MTCVHLRDPSGLAAYAVALSDTGTLAQIAVHPDLRRRGLAKALVSSLQTARARPDLRVINVDASDRALAAFMTSLHARPITGQRELALNLRPSQ